MVEVGAEVDSIADGADSGFKVWLLGTVRATGERTRATATRHPPLSPRNSLVSHWGRYKFATRREESDPDERRFSGKSAFPPHAAELPVPPAYSVACRKSSCFFDLVLGFGLSLPGAGAVGVKLEAAPVRYYHRIQKPGVSWVRGYTPCQFEGSGGGVSMKRVPGMATGDSPAFPSLLSTTRRALV